jgi:RNA polymerase sigma-70 factor (ECF subfamily)
MNRNGQTCVSEAGGMDRWQLPCDPLLALQQGDPEPFESFVRLHARTMMAFFRQRGAPSARCEDLAQEVFLKLHQGAPRYRPEERFSSYCFRIARNVWIDECRRVGVRQELAQGGEGGDELVPFAPPVDPTAGLIEAEESASVLRLLATLPESHRVVFELAVLFELGYGEIAMRLGIPVGTVKSRMFYAVRRLREELAQRSPEVRP